MADFRKGDRVKFTLEVEGTICDVYADGTVAVRLDGEVLNVWLDDEDVPTARVAMERVQHADPTGWPPQLGDVWAVGGGEWYTRTEADTAELWLAPPNPGGAYYTSIRGAMGKNFGDFKALNPVLKYRRDS